jgi:hypothetical protein
LGFKPAKLAEIQWLIIKKGWKKLWRKPEENNHQSGIQPKEMWDERGH